MFYFSGPIIRDFEALVKGSKRLRTLFLLPLADGGERSQLAWELPMLQARCVALMRINMLASSAGGLTRYGPDSVRLYRESVAV